MTYKVQWAYRLVELVERINVDIQVGWKLQGGVACTVKDGVTQYFQALIKE